MSKITDIFQNFIISNPKRAIWFMTSMKPEFWEKQGEKKVLKTFHETAEKVPAYEDFLKKHKIKNHNKIQTIEDFKKYVPIMDKNYLINYPLKDISKGDLNESYTLYISGGTTMSPIYILASRENFKTYPLGMFAIFDYFWDISHQKVLFINALSLGLWIGGVIGNFLYKTLCDKYKNFTVVTPGADPEKVVDVLEKIGEHYDLIFISSYPTLFKMILDEGDRRKIQWEKLNIRVGGGGDTVDDSLIDYFTKKLNPAKKIPWFIFEGYGATEFGSPALSTPLTIKIKRLTKDNSELSQDIFRTNEPAKLFQFNPLNNWIESINNDIIITGDGKIPLIRYNIQDLGKIIRWQEMNKILKSHNINVQEELRKDGFTKPPFQWPFLTFLGRKDWAISYLGVKISPYQLLSILETDPKIHSFKIAAKENKETLVSHFLVFLEIKPSVQISEKEKIKLKRYYQHKILNHLLKTNIDFKDGYSINKEILTPKVEIYSFRQGPFREETRRIKPNLIVKIG